MRAAVAGTVAALGLVIGTAPGANADTTEFRLSDLGTTPGYDWQSQVVAISPSKAWAFGEVLTGGLPTARRWNGRKWRDVSLPAGLTRGITIADASGPRNVWAFGGGDETGDAYALRWDGSAWTVAHRWPGDEMISDAAVLAPDDVWVFGTSHIGPGIGTWHYDGATWTRVTTGDDFLREGSAVSADDIWAIGTNETGERDNLVSRWDGTAWNPVDVPSSPTDQFSGIYAASPDDVWIAGSEYRPSGDDATYVPFVLHFDGTAWQRLDPPVTGGGSLSEVASDGQGGIWFVPQTFEPYDSPELLRYSGGRWTAIRPERPGGQAVRVHDVASVPGGRVTWAVGEVFPPDRATSDSAVWVNGTLRH